MKKYYNIRAIFFPEKTGGAVVEMQAESKPAELLSYNAGSNTSSLSSAFDYWYVKRAIHLCICSEVEGKTSLLFKQ